MRLLITQKNDIFDTILEEGQNPNDFHLQEVALSNNELVSRINYKNTSYTFTIRKDYSTYLCEYSPGRESMDDEKLCRTWRSVPPVLKIWIRSLLREDIDDKWAIFKNNIKTLPFNFATNDNDSGFTEFDLKLLNTKIENIKTDISKLNLPQYSIDTILNKLDVLNEKADSLSQIHWKELFMGGIIGLIFNLSITPDLAGKIWDIIRDNFSSLLLTK